MKSEHKYGSPEYKLDEIKEKADEVHALLKQFRVENGQIIKFAPISFGGAWLSPSRIEGKQNYGSSLDNFVKWGNYCSFDKTKKDHIERSFEEAMKWHNKAVEEVEKWHLENIPHIENNQKVKESVENFMRMVGIPFTYKEEDTKSRSRTKKYIDRAAGFISDLNRNCPTNDGYENAKRILADFVVRAEKWKKDHLDNIAKLEREKAASDKQIRIVARAMELAKQHLITEYKTNDELIDLVTEIEKENWVKENYSDGMPVDHSSCDSCSTWYYGEHRCKCGNRRMNLVVEGNILDGFSAYVEAY